MPLPPHMRASEHDYDDDAGGDGEHARLVQVLGLTVAP